MHPLKYPHIDSRLHCAMDPLILIFAALIHNAMVVTEVLQCLLYF